MSAVPQARGYTGFGGIPGWIMTVYGAANEYNLQRVEAATVHELHHNVLGACPGCPGEEDERASDIPRYIGRKCLS